MKKSLDKNTLIQKQLKEINKKEAKLTKENNNYIKNKLAPIAGKFEEKIPKKLQTTLEVAFEKGFKTVFDKGSSIIEKTYNKDEINMEHDINSYAISKFPSKKHFKKLDKSINKKNLLNKSLTVFEGSALGLLGIGLPDIPIYIGLILKSIYEISLSYGFDYTLDYERAYILNIICSSTTTGNERKLYFERLDQMANEIDNEINLNYDLAILLTETSKRISSYMITAKFVQGLPIVGVVGGITNLTTLGSITTIAKLKYKKRYLKSLI